MLGRGGRTVPAAAVVRFRVFEFDLCERELRKRGSRIKLQGQQAQVLSILLERPGRLVTREDLRKGIWADGRFVEFDRGINKAIYGLRRALSDSRTSPAYIETVTGRGYRFVAAVQGNGASCRQFDERALVVLPIANLSGDALQEYIADGITETLIGVLGQVAGLRVISRTSAMSYKGSRKGLSQIAAELGAEFAVEGSFVRSNSVIRVCLRLIDTQSEKQLWADNREGRITSVAVLVDEAAQAIRNFVAARFCAAPLLTPAVQTDPDALDAYLRGKYHWNRRTGRDLVRSLDLYRRALELDPDLAVAHAGVADALILFGVWGLRHPMDVFPQARAAAVRALEIDGTLAEAHTVLAEVRKDYDWDWKGAEREYRQAIALNPAYATARHWYAQLLSMLGRHQEASIEIRQAHLLEPFSIPINAFVAYIHLVARRCEDAIIAAKRALDLDPRSALAHWYLGRAYCLEEKWNEAIDALRQSLELSPDLPLFKGDLALALRRAGKSSSARSVLEDVQQAATMHYVSPVHLGKVHLGTGCRESALHCLQRAMSERTTLALGLRDPEFDELRCEPGFRKLCARLKLSTRL